MPAVPPSAALRAFLEKKSPAELFKMLKKIDARRAKDIEKKNEINNKRRLIRAIEIANALGNVPPLPSVQKEKYNVEWIYLDIPDKKLVKNIEIRLDARIMRGMVAEVEHLRESGVSWKRLNELGLEYREVARYLRGEVSKQEMRDELLRKIIRYAKRQKRWFGRGAKI